MTNQRDDNLIIADIKRARNEVLEECNTGNYGHEEFWTFKREGRMVQHTYDWRGDHELLINIKIRQIPMVMTKGYDEGSITLDTSTGLITIRINDEYGYDQLSPSKTQAVLNYYNEEYIKEIE